jgi:chromosome segregation ATPase
MSQDNSITELKVIPIDISDDAPINQSVKNLPADIDISEDKTNETLNQTPEQKIEQIDGESVDYTGVNLNNDSVYDGETNVENNNNVCNDETSKNFSEENTNINETTKIECEKLLSDLMNKFNVIVESHENQLKAKEKAEEYLKKLDQHMTKLNNEKQSVVNSIEKCQARIDDGESENDNIKEEIKKLTNDISTACIDGKMDDYANLTISIKNNSEKLYKWNEKKEKFISEQEINEKDKEYVETEITKCKELTDDIKQVFEKTTIVNNMEKNVEESEIIKNYIREINLGIEGLANLGAISTNESEWIDEKDLILPKEIMDI